MTAKRKSVCVELYRRGDWWRIGYEISWESFCKEEFEQMTDVPSHAKRCWIKATSYPRKDAAPFRFTRKRIYRDDCGLWFLPFQEAIQWIHKTLGQMAKGTVYLTFEWE